MITRDEHPPEEVNDHGLDRRDVLRAAAGGFVLTASGLFLPADDEAAAREGAYGGELGGRRGKDRRGLDKRKRRDHNHKKGKKDDDRGAPPQSHGPFRTAAMTVEGNWTDRQRWTFTFFYRVKTGLDPYGPWLLAHSANPADDALYRYAPDRYRVGVLLAADTWAGPGPNQAFVDVRNMSFTYPLGSASFGAGLDPVQNKLGAQLIAERDFAQPSDWFGDGSAAVGKWGLWPGPHASNATIVLKRHNDSDGAIEFRLQVDF